MLIFLVGFMGCGKSYVGRHLAPLLQYDYIDLDKFIEDNEGMSIKEIFEQKGEAYFRNLERNFINNIDAQQNIVISTGGGAPCFFDNMEIMNTKGITIYLNRSKKTTLERLHKGKHKRPLIADLSDEELSDFYDERLAGRKPFYDKAQLHVGDADVEIILAMIREKIN
ncbi:MAG TPA: shikimate kinase [Chitinophagales bacterium]|nr:shikimate kinase [Chitinophagales bacterium]HMX60083.1 shikimate kinase [Chitinophagales bacterium]HMY23079.1 shikimate kinase [Chitinophagales bacterium]HNA38694.1 shikimate kinase [Chitinophagales bacterium]HNB48349.1 shikimate kinase [Chitinophagales bacterium]